MSKGEPHSWAYCVLSEKSTRRIPISARCHSLNSFEESCIHRVSRIYLWMTSTPLDIYREPLHLNVVMPHRHSISSFQLRAITACTYWCAQKNLGQNQFRLKSSRFAWASVAIVVGQKNLIIEKKIMHCFFIDHKLAVLYQSCDGAMAFMRLFFSFWFHIWHEFRFISAFACIFFWKLIR